MAMTLVDVPIRHIASIRLFSRLAEDRLTALAAASTEHLFELGEVIFLKGDRPSGLFAVMSGTIKMTCQGPSGDEKVIGLRGAKDVFGEESVFEDRSYAYMATALSRTCLLHVDKRTLCEVIDACDAFRLSFIAHMSHRLFQGMRDIEDFRTRAPLERLAGFLLDQCTPAQHSHPKVNLLAPKHVIASRLGMTPESLSRCLRDMAEDRILASCGAVITILDRERLGALVG